MANLEKIMKEMQQMQSKFMDAQNKMHEVEFSGTAGGGMVSININGKGDITKLEIDPKIMTPDDVEIVSDLIIASFNDAKHKLESQMNEQMGALLPPNMNFLK